MSDNKAAEKKPGNDKKDFAALSAKARSKFGEFKSEFKKIIWPDKKTLAKHTVTVILTSLLVGVVIVALDFVFGNAYTLFIRLLG